MTIEIHELDITDGLNKTLYDELKAENEKLKKKLGIALDTLDMLAHLRKEFDERYREFAGNGIKQIKEVA